jgi:hypothetical protein
VSAIPKQNPNTVKRNVLVCFAWIGSVLVFGLLVWLFTMPYRTRLLIETVNTVLAESGGGRIETRRNFSFSPASVMGGSWFPINNAAEKVFVFSVLRNGIAAACVAIVDSGGKVRTILPLSGNARQIIKELPLPVYRFYVNRIEQDPRSRVLNKELMR